MALTFCYLIARRLLGILLGRLRGQHANDIEIAGHCCIGWDGARVATLLA